jgi:uncharacterized protein (UPF0371 family)
VEDFESIAHRDIQHLQKVDDLLDRRPAEIAAVFLGYFGCLLDDLRQERVLPGFGQE